MADSPIPDVLPSRSTSVDDAALAELGGLIRERAGEIGDQAVARWTERRGDLDDVSGMEADVASVCRIATMSVSQFIATGQAPSEENRRRMSDVGRAAANATVEFSEVTKIQLNWRDSVLGVLREESQRLGFSPETLREANQRVHAHFDWSLFVMAERFDLRRKELQSQLAEEQGRLAHQALHDPLTGLPNRVFFLERLSQAVDAATRRSIRSAVLFVDIDRFKAINDVAGHAAGDQLIVGVGNRLRDMLRPGDTVARLGGDEFVILCENLLDAQSEAIGIAERICSVMVKPFSTPHSELFTSASIGIAFVKPGDDPHVLVARADSAMYMAKQHGRARYELYHPAFDERTTRRAELINGLHTVIERQELCLHYQPVKALSSGQVVAMEALCRWQHPTLGTVAPTEFIPLAEETGLIVDIGRWVLAEAAAQCRQWRAEGFGAIDVSVNVSGRQLAEPDFAKDVERVLKATGLPPSALTMEVTESVLVTEGSTAHAVMNDLQALGIRIAIDDFGIGYSSLSYLAKLPVHSLKVDRSFIAGLGSPGQDASIVTAMVELAHKLGLAVVAEGVETEAELAELRRAHCDEAQGFLLGCPAPFGNLRQAGALGPRS
jgi:diguanylate cyclase (GGDEF)-like protein